MISPDARPGGQAPTGYEDLARWLVRSLTADAVELEDVETTGRRIGRELPTSDPEQTGERVMRAALAALGFAPEVEFRENDQLVYRLRNCPYREAVRERQPLVCALHRGITRGLLDSIDPDTSLVGFVPADPDAGGCMIELRGPMGKPPAA